MRSFTLECDILTTPCGHLFHTGCIEWLNESTDCYQCQKACEIQQMIKLNFSESQSAIKEHISINDLEQQSLEFEKKSLICNTLLLDKSNEITQVMQKCKKLEQEILLMRLDWSKMKRKNLEKDLDPDDPPI